MFTETTLIFTHTNQNIIILSRYLIPRLKLDHMITFQQMCAQIRVVSLNMRYFFCTIASDMRYVADLDDALPTYIYTGCPRSNGPF